MSAPGLPTSSVHAITRSCPAGHMPLLGVFSLDLGRSSGWPFFVQVALKARRTRASKAELRPRHSLSAALRRAPARGCSRGAERGGSRPIQGSVSSCVAQGAGRVASYARADPAREPFSTPAEQLSRASPGSWRAVRRLGRGLTSTGTGRHADRHQSGGRESERQRIERRAPAQGGRESGQEDEADADHRPIVRRRALLVQTIGIPDQGDRVKQGGDKRGCG